MRFTRREALRAAGVAVALPWLECRGASAEAPARRRMVCICTPLGLYAPVLFPEKSGTGYELTPYLEVIQEYRQDLTIISGLRHPEIDFGHESIYSFLTSAPRPGKPGFQNQISLDQLAAEHTGGRTRFPHLALSEEGFSLSWTRSGAIVPADTSPARVFTRMFLDGRPEEIQAQVRRLRDGQSILDRVLDQTRRLHAGLGPADREKLDEYTTSVRELEQRLATSESWAEKPKPRVDVKPLQDISNSADILGRARLLFDLTHLALQTDSTRLVTILLSGITPVPLVPGVSEGHHNLSHHGKDPKKIEQLSKVEVAVLEVFRELLTKLRQTREEDGSLLEKTMVLLGSNLGNGSSHSCQNLPMLLVGGGFRHGQHLAFDPAKPPPLCNLYVTMLQRLGLEIGRFGSSTGTLRGLDFN